MKHPQREKVGTIRDFLDRSGWVREAGPLRFLAAGEYNENYLVTAGNRRYVFRINHGSQLGLRRQVEYEYRVLRAVERSGVTPRAFFVEQEVSGYDGVLGKGVLLMEYLPGGRLDYRRDLERAAGVFARVHTLSPPTGLIEQRDPVRAIARESLDLMNRYPDHPLTGVYRLLRSYHERMLRLAEDTARAFASQRLCVVNTEVNAGNFLVDLPHVRLVDWEKAVVSCRYQDLGHFLAPTTTLWKTGYRFDRKARTAFLSAYAGRCSDAPDPEELSLLTGVMEQVILLRALSWCYMAYYEYTRRERELTGRGTLRTIRRYMREAECFLS
jgi:Ser/Thr protein kinase RdoA (MazF antagonist)